MQRLQRFGIKPDGIINFLSNEPPLKQSIAKDTPELCSAEVHLKFQAHALPLPPPGSAVMPRSQAERNTQVKDRTPGGFVRPAAFFPYGQIHSKQKLYPLRNSLPGAHGVIPEKVMSKRA
jgi:hypothetical protein